jgi:hypothetical protein
LAAGEDLRGQQSVAAEGDLPEAVDAAFNLNRIAVLNRRQRGWSGRDRTGRGQLGQVIDG